MANLQLKKIKFLNSSIQPKNLRISRMQAFLELVRPPEGAKIIDLGGTPELWNLIDHTLEVTIVNLPSKEKEIANSRYKMIFADACDLSQIFSDKAFDIVFSNSVIEHVGNEERQALFSKEVQRLANAYWVQTPSPIFPIEAHTGALFYWQRSAKAREKLIQQWEKTLPAWTDMIKELQVLSRKRLLELFPNSKIYCERFLGIEKSNSAYIPYKKNI